jgi:hypothetical protein
MSYQQVCDKHGGKSPQALAKANERMFEKRVRGLISGYVSEPVTDPVSELMRLAGDAKRWYQVLEDVVDSLGDRMRYTDAKGSENLRAEIAVYERAMDRLMQLLSTMARLNLAERAVRIDEAKAKLLIELVSTAMRRTNIPPTAQAEVWAVLRELIAAQQASDPLVIEVQASGEQDLADSLG